MTQEIGATTSPREAEAAFAAPMASTAGPQLRFILFRAGKTGRSLLVEENLSQALREYAPDAFRIEIIDVLEDPALAERHRILATPTVLVFDGESEMARLVGDLSDLALLRAWCRTHLPPQKGGTPP